MRKHIKHPIALMLALVMLCALAVPAFASSPDYVTPTGKWDTSVSSGIRMAHHKEYVDPDNPTVVVVPDFRDYAIDVDRGAIKNPNMKVISLPRDIHIVYDGNGVENCTEIIYRGTKDEWFGESHVGNMLAYTARPKFGWEEKYPFRIPVKTLDGEIIDYVGPETAPIVGGQDEPAEPDTDPDFVTPTGKWNDGGGYGDSNILAYNDYLDRNDPAVVVVPGLNGYGIWIDPGTIKDPNMKIISLPREINTVSAGNGIENCTEIIYRGTEDEWFGALNSGYHQLKSGRPMFGQEDKFPYRIPVKTLDGDIIDYVGPASAPVVGSQDKPAEPEKPVQQPAITFSDVPAGAWYADAVNWAVEKGIVNGTSPTTFSPTQTCTNAQIITLLYRATGSPAVSGVTLPFAVKNTWAGDAVKWAYSRNVIDGNFNEEAPCTRYAAVGCIWKAFGCPAAQGGTNFSDIAGLDARPIAWAVGKGIVNGTSATTFSPDLTCDRGTIVTLLHRAYK